MKTSIRHTIVASALLPALAALPAGATVFDGPARTVTVGGDGADFPSLAAAAADFNASVPPISGDWVIEIGDSLVEPANISFANTVSTTGSVTIRPKAGLKPVITFTNTAANSGGHPGHLLIGGRTAGTNPTFATSNFIIDGSNGDPGDGPRDLTIRNTPEVAGNSRLIVVIGASTNVAIRNAILENLATSANPMVVSYKVWGPGAGLDYLYPDNGTVEHCELRATAGTNTQALTTVFGGSGNNPNLGINGLTIRDNFIASAHQGANLSFLRSAEISGNTIRIRSSATNLNSAGVRHQGGNNSTGGVINIHGNRIDQLETSATTAGTSGITGLDLTPTGASNPPVDVTYNVYNNVISGFAAGPTGANILLRGIASNFAGATLNVWHNSIHIRNSPGATGLTGANAYGIGQVAASFNGIDWRNNIVRVEQAGAAALSKAASGTDGYVSDHNVLSAAAGAATGYLAGAARTTLGDWTAASGGDGNSVDTNPTSLWLNPTSWPADLHLNSAPPPSFTGPPIPSVTTDIDDDPRSAITPSLGADEFTGAASASDWLLY